MSLVAQFTFASPQSDEHLKIGVILKEFCFEDPVNLLTFVAYTCVCCSYIPISLCCSLHVNTTCSIRLVVHAL